MSAFPNEKEIFLSALDLSRDDERAAYLERVCNGDDALRARVEHLLSMHRQSGGEELAGPPDLDLVGRRVEYFGDYELLEVIARGAMGVVYRARQTSLRREVAVKMIRGALLASEEDVARFRNEAEAAAVLDHPNIVPVYEVGVCEGQHYFSMRYVPGGTLADRLQDFRNDPRGMTEVMEGVARAVHAAHQRGILHRDLKPGNILLGPDGAPQITDFGLAKRLGGVQSLTLSGQMLGTPYYMAPEQAAGGSAGVTTAADIYALGAILYELLAGAPPFRGASLVETLRLAAESPPPRIVPPEDRDLETIARKCLEKEPARRYASASELADDLARWQRGEPVRARSAGAAEQLWKWGKRRPAHAALALAGGALILLFGIGGPVVAARQNRLKQEAQELAEVSSRNLYAAEMNLAGQAFSELGGMARLGDLVDHWSAPDALGIDRRGWEWHFLDAERKRHDRIVPLPTHFRGVANSPDGTRFAAVGGTLGVFIYDRSTGQSVTELRTGQNGWGLCVAWSLDGRFIATGNTDRSVAVVEAETGALVAKLNMPREVEAVSFSSGYLHAVGGNLSGEHIWKTADWKPAGEAIGEGSLIAAVVSPNGTLVGRKELEHFSLADPKGPEHWRIPRDNRRSEPVDFAFSPDGSLIAAAMGDATVELLRTSDGSRAGLLEGLSREIRMLAWNPDSSEVVAVGDDRAAALWDVRSGHLLGLADLPQPIENVVWSADGTRLLTLAVGSTMHVWDVARLRRERAAFSKAREFLLAWEPDGGELLAGGVPALIWSPDTHRTTHLPGDGLALPQWLPGGREFLGVFEARIVVKDRFTGSMRELFQIGEDSRFAWVQPSADGRHFLLSYHYKPAEMRSITDGSLVLRLPDEGRGVFSRAKFSPDDRLIAAIQSDQVLLVNPSDGHIVRALPVQGTAAEIEWSRDGRRLAVAAHARISVFDGDRDWRETLLPLQSGDIVALAWTPDGRRLATSGNDGAIRLWDTETWQSPLTLLGHGGGVTALAFSSDGKTLASWSFDKTVRLWHSDRDRQ